MTPQARLEGRDQEILAERRRKLTAARLARDAGHQPPPVEMPLVAVRLTSPPDVMLAVVAIISVLAALTVTVPLPVAVLIGRQARFEPPPAQTVSLALGDQLDRYRVVTRSPAAMAVLAAAFTEICCPTMERASVWKGSPRPRRAMRGCWRMISPSMGSLPASARLALAQ